MSWPTSNPTAVYGSPLTEDTQITPSSAFTFGLGQLNAWTVVGPLTLVTLQLKEDSAVPRNRPAANRTPSPALAGGARI